MLTKLKLIYWRWVRRCCQEDFADITSFLEHEVEQGVTDSPSIENARLERVQTLKDWRKADSVISELERKLR